jgi:tubulin polyglutamylase TTLL6/13
MRQQLNAFYEKNRENMEKYLKVEQGIDILAQHSNLNN